jgi:hypothetical protein
MLSFIMVSVVILNVVAPFYLLNETAANASYVCGLELLSIQNSNL